MSVLAQFGSLKEALADWQDADVAAYYLARCLGIIEHNVSFAASKSIVFTSNPVSDMLYQTLNRMVEARVLEHDADEQRYRWCQSSR